jgi:hypothetical protein
MPAGKVLHRCSSGGAWLSHMLLHGARTCSPSLRRIQPTHQQLCNTLSCRTSGKDVVARFDHTFLFAQFIGVCSSLKTQL